MEKKKGGSRLNAGRKKIDTAKSKNKIMRVTEIEHSVIIAMRKKHECTLSDVIEHDFWR